MKRGLAALATLALLSAACSPALGLVPEGTKPNRSGSPGVPGLAEGTLSNQLCLACHEQDNLTIEVGSGQGQVLDKIDSQTFAESAHGGEVCVSCHEAQARLPHEKIEPPVASKPGALVDVIAVCASCHQEAYEGYFHTAHGTVKNLGDTRAPDCVDCHGAHNVRSIEDWTYDERGEMCAQCHGGADATFARSAIGHREPARDWFPSSYFAGRFLIILTAAVLALGVLHTELDILRWGIARATGYRRDGRGQ